MCFWTWTTATASCLASLPSIYLSCYSQGDHVTILSKILQWLPIFHRTKSRTLNQHSESLGIWSCHLPPFLPLPWRPSSPKELLVPRTRQSDFAFSAFFVMHLPVFRPWHLFSWDGISSGESSRSSGLLHCHSPPSWTWSRAHYVGTLHCMSTVLPGRASRACLLVHSQPASGCPARCLVCGRGPGIGSWTELLAFAPSRLLSH